MRSNASPSLSFKEFRVTSFPLCLLGSGSEGIEPDAQFRVTFPACGLIGPVPISFRSFERNTRHQGDRIWQ
jgi:hypothetical protein